MFGLGFGELILIFLIALIFIGPKKLPELAKGLGQGIREFQKAAKGFTDHLQETTQDPKSGPSHVASQTPTFVETPSEADKAAHPPLDVVSADHKKTNESSSS